MNSLQQSFDKMNLRNRYDVKKQIGAGSYGSVVKAVDLTTGKEVAIKRIGHVFDDLIDGKRILREIALLKKLHHPNIVNLLDVFVPNDDYENFNELCLVLEFAPSDLKKLFRRNGYLKESDVVKITYDMLLGLKYIHSAGVWHRDLKPANVLVFEHGLAKICDFGLARTVEETFTDKKLEKGASTTQLEPSPQIQEDDTKRPKLKKASQKSFKTKLNFEFESLEIKSAKQLRQLFVKEILQK